ncbi:MAG: hypothetical protein M1832_003619 [Thelocarpon impressellum]|nr:MAG: hypothetical protein M1832_003619 [Thelocarpon impressellum]
MTIVLSYIPSKLAPSPFRRLRFAAAAARPRNTLSLLRFLLPHTRERARARLFDFRHETVPHFRQRVQSRIYRFIVDGQLRRRQNRAAGTGIIASLRGRGRRSLGFRTTDDVASRRTKMSQTGYNSELPDAGGDPAQGSEGRTRGARRQKLAGYLKAANELRQTYQQSYTSRGSPQPEPGNGDHDVPGSFPDAAVVRSADEEMVLFPSYARRHVKKERLPDPVLEDGQAGLDQNGRRRSTAEDADYWREEWRRHEDDKAIVDVDVRGWIYSPHRGPMSRRSRLMIGLARQLSGIPAPPSAAQGAGETHEERANARAARLEEQLVAREAEKILELGRGEADIAERGGYSEEPKRDSDRESIYSRGSRSSTPDRTRSRDSRHSRTSHPLREAVAASDDDEGEVSRSMSKRRSWNQPAEMTQAELSVANANLMARLKPFLHDPIVSAPVTVFFYNERTSQSRSIMTNEAGHFLLRAALDFVPTEVRVLASDSLSATEKILITEPTGVSVISDIDDTIKHSAVGSGAKEIFRNAFIRDLGDLTIEGVREWYARLAELGVKFHYVSNSPWQLYPVLVSYFAMAGLPPGSFHLKQYSGMLQGIFEPVAERKKGTLSRIMEDFPDRKFILVGDSGEADLEVYTDVVLANPGRIIGVYIRDITSPVQQGFFDSAMGPIEAAKSVGDETRDTARPREGGRPAPEERPVLPPRRSMQPFEQQRPGPAMRKLIDFDEDVPTYSESPRPQSMIESVPRVADERRASTSSMRSPGPARPAKPARLQSRPAGGAGTRESRGDSDSSPSRTEAPPLPAKPRRLSENRPLTAASGSPPTFGDPASMDRQGYLPGVRQKAWSAYNRLPSASSVLYGTGLTNGGGAPPQPNRPGASPSAAASQSSREVSPGAPSTQGSRRGLTAYPAAAAQYASNRLGNAWSGSGAAEDGVAAATNAAPVNKKEELWKRRWARARDVLESKGVRLRAWRVGEDVMDDAAGLVEQVKREGERKERGMRRGRKAAGEIQGS